MMMILSFHYCCKKVSYASVNMSCVVRSEIRNCLVTRCVELDWNFFFGRCCCVCRIKEIRERRVMCEYSLVFH